MKNGEAAFNTENTETQRARRKTENSSLKGFLCVLSVSVFSVSEEGERK